MALGEPQHLFFLQAPVALGPNVQTLHCKKRQTAEDGALRPTLENSRSFHSCVACFEEMTAYCLGAGLCVFGQLISFCPPPGKNKVPDLHVQVPLQQWLDFPTTALEFPRKSPTWNRMEAEELRGRGLPSRALSLCALIPR